MDYTVPGVAKSQTWLSDFHSLTHYNLKDCVLTAQEDHVLGQGLANCDLLGQI